MTDLNPVRQPPNNTEAEQAVLGAMLISKRALDTGLESLSSSDFYREKHRLIFEAMSDYVANGKEVDAITLLDWFTERRAVDRIDNGGYLIELANETPGAANVSGYANQVRKKAMARELIEVSLEASDDAWQGGDAEKIAARMVTRMMAFGVDTSSRPRTFAEIGRSWLSMLQSRLEGQTQIQRTGLMDVDRHWHGLRPSDLIIMAGRPAMGKTTLAMSIAENVAKSGWVHIFSLEMDAEDLYQRWVAHDVDQERLMEPENLQTDDWSRITRGISQSKEHKILIDDEGGTHINKIMARARQAKVEHDTKVIIVDYIQLVQGDGERRTESIGHVTRMLKKLAKELKVPVIALSQLNRGLESRPDKRPMLSDLRESGEIEQDADIVAFLYREAVYNENFESNVTELITRKFRNGATGTDLLMMLPRQQRFVSADYDAKREYNVQMTAGAPRKSKWQRG
mgnify:CR=1 FL=1